MDNNIRHYRQLADMTMTELAEQTGISRAYLHKLENEGHNPSVDIAFNISEVLGVSVYFLFHDKWDDRTLLTHLMNTVSMQMQRMGLEKCRAIVNGLFPLWQMEDRESGE